MMKVVHVLIAEGITKVLRERNLYHGKSGTLLIIISNPP